MKITDWARQRWFLASLAAFSFSLSHLFVDFQIGLFGESSISMSFLQAALIATIGVLFGWWAFAVGEARHGSRSGIVVAFTFAFGWAFVLNRDFRFAFPEQADATPVSRLQAVFLIADAPAP